MESHKRFPDPQSARRSPDRPDAQIARIGPRHAVPQQQSPLKSGHGYIAGARRTSSVGATLSFERVPAKDGYLPEAGLRRGAWYAVRKPLLFAWRALPIRLTEREPGADDGEPGRR
jgi:hypothetical protein